MREAVQVWAGAHLPPPLAILLCSMLPILELRGGIARVAGGHDPRCTAQIDECRSFPVLARRV